MGRIILHWQPSKDFPSKAEWDVMPSERREAIKDEVWDVSRQAKEHFATVQSTIGKIIIGLWDKYAATAFLTSGGFVSAELLHPFVVSIDISFPDEHRDAVRKELATIISFFHS